MKTNIINKESEKRTYITPFLDIVRLDNEISLVLNSFQSLPGDPTSPDCDIDYAPDLNSDSPWE